MSIPNLHPMFVHLPIALLSTSLLFDFLGYRTGRVELQRTGWWTLLVGSIGLIGAVISGLLAERTATIPPAAQEHLETHKQMAFLVAALYAVALFVRVANKTSLPKGRERVYVGLSLIGVALTWLTASFGGELVFRFGVGVSTR